MPFPANLLVEELVQHPPACYRPTRIMAVQWLLLSRCWHLHLFCWEQHLFSDYRNLLNCQYILHPQLCTEEKIKYQLTVCRVSRHRPTAAQSSDERLPRCTSNWCRIASTSSGSRVTCCIGSMRNDCRERLWASGARSRADRVITNSGCFLPPSVSSGKG